MPVRFSPNGFLDVATDASDLPIEMSGKVLSSGAMTRCTNLILDRAGIASTRKGSSKVSETALATPIWRLVEMGGVRYAFGGIQIYRNEVSIGSGYTSSRWSAIKYNAYNVVTQSVFALNGTDRKRITASTVAEWGIEAPTVAPTLSGSITGYAYTQGWEGTSHATSNSFQWGRTEGNYQVLYDWEEAEVSGDSETYRHHWFFERATNKGITSRIGVQYTYVRKSGTTVECESNPSDEAFIEANTGIFVTWTAPTDSQVTHIRLYRTLDGGTTYLYSQEYAISVTTGALMVDDGSLGTEAATDHDRPPLGNLVAGPDFNGVCFIAKGNLLYFCLAQQPEYWPALYYVEVCPPQETIKSVVVDSGQVYCLTDTGEIYLIQGTGAASFFPLRQSAVTGSIGGDGVLALRGVGLLHVGTDGLWAFSGASDDNVTNDRFRPIFQGTTRGSIPGASQTQMGNCWLLTHRGKLYFGYPDTSSTYPSDVLVTDLSSKKTVHFDYGVGFSAVTVDVANNRILAGDTSGYIWELEDADATVDGATAISWQWESAEVSDQMRLYMPRYAKYDAEVGGTAAAYIILDGSSKQTHTLTGSRNTTKRLVGPCNGHRMQSRITGTGTIDIYGIELE